MSQAAIAAYELGAFRIDVGRRLLTGADGQPIFLKPKVFDTLLYLVEHAGELCDKRDLMTAIWPGLVVEENNLNQSVSALRRVLGERPGEHRFIVTEPGRGYRFVAPVNALSAAPPAQAAASPQPIPLPPSAGPLDPADALPGAREAAPSPGVVGWVRGRRLVGVLVALFVFVAALVFWPKEATSPASTTGLATESVAAPQGQPNSIAVLPFEVVGPDPGQIADGLHIELINKLTQAGLAVKARGAVVQYAGSARDFGAIAAEQSVESILVGSLQQAGDRLRFNVTLVDATGFNKWVSPPYEIEPTDVFRVQADIATNVTEALRSTLSPNAQQRLNRRPTESLSAQLAYWQALGAQNAGPRSRALALLEDAVRIDPNFADAHAQLALLYGRSLVDIFTDPATTATAQDIYALVVRHAERALSLDPEQAAAHVALGEANLYLWHWGAAAKAYEDAYDTNPRDMDVLTFYSQFSVFNGDFGRAAELATQARELDANSLYPTWLTYTYSGNVDAALDWLGRQLTIDERQVTAWLNSGYIEARRGNREAAVRAFRIVEGLAGAQMTASAKAGLAYGYSRVALNDEARRLVDDVKRHADDEIIGDGAWVQVNLVSGARDEAIAALERAVAKIENHEPAQAWFALMIIKHNLLGDPVLETSPFRELRARIRGD